VAIARSYLFVPGNRPERFSKACGAGADEVILDLEDAVPAAEKDAARSAVADWLSPARRVLVRVNDAGTRWFADDLALCRTPGVAGIVLPKAERADVIAAVAQSVGAGVRVLPLIESARGLWGALAVAEAPQVQRLAFGSIDFQVDLGIRGDAEELDHFRAQLVLVSRLASLQAPIDGVTPALDDAARTQSDALRARRRGFGAKLCIHPRQVALVNAAFAPLPAEVEWARRVLAAAAAADGAAVAVDGRMVDRPVILQAEDIVRESERATTAIPIENDRNE
jgi:citrate lyase subunit beta/citryl-CoA lyase